MACLTSTPTATRHTELVIDVPEDELRAMLDATQGWTLFPPAADRSEWSRLLAVPWRTDHAERVVAAAAARADQPIRPWRASEYLAFSRTGDRHGFQQVYFEPRTRLALLALAEAIEHDGRFIDDVADLVWMICDEATWCIPAHLGQFGSEAAALPHRDPPVIDLFATQTGFLLAVVSQLLGAELDQVSPVVVERVHSHVRDRVTAPLIERPDQWWWLDLGTNWNPWCVSNVLGAALCSPTEPVALAAIVRRGAASLGAYLDQQRNDGSIEEGPGYWNVAVGCVGVGFELLRSRTNGALDGFHHPKLRATASYLPRVHLDAGLFTTFGDARFTSGVRPGEAHLLGVRCGADDLARLAPLAVKGWRHDGPPAPELDADAMSSASLGYFFDWFWLPDDLSTEPHERPLFDAFEEFGLWLFRSSATEGEGFAVAVKGGHNAEAHGHSDVGQVVAMHDGVPIFVDMGMAVYSAEDFGPAGHEIWYRRGANHNLPVVNGHEQVAGSAAAAALLGAQTDARASAVRLSVESVYPPEAGVVRAEREVSLHRSDTPMLSIVDALETSLTGAETVTSFLTTSDISSGDAGAVRLGRLTLRAAADEPAHVAVHVEAVDIHDDPAMTQAFGDRLQRVSFTVTSSESTVVVRYLLQATDGT